MARAESTSALCPLFTQSGQSQHGLRDAFTSSTFQAPVRSSHCSLPTSGGTKGHRDQVTTPWRVSQEEWAGWRLSAHFNLSVSWFHHLLQRLPGPKIVSDP